MKAWIINLIIVLFCLPLAAQKMSKSEKISKEKPLLEAFHSYDRNQKINACKELITIWFDTSRYDIKILDNHEPFENKKLNLRIASVLEDKTDKYKQILVFFDESTGKIRKTIDLKNINPYTKSKNPKIDDELVFRPSSIENFIHKIDEIGNLRTIDKYISEGYSGVWRGNHMIMFTRKYGLHKGLYDIYWVVDQWTNFLVFDTLGNIIMNHELNEAFLLYQINKNASFFVVHFGSDGWKRDGFIIYDINNCKEIYRYDLTEQDRKNGKMFAGANFCKKNHFFVSGVNRFNFKSNFDSEFIIIDIVKMIEYKYTFTRSEFQELTSNWFKKYKSLENLIRYFDFEERKL